MSPGQVVWVLRKLGKRRQALAELHNTVGRLQELANEDLGVALHTRAAHRLEIRDAGEAERDLQPILPHAWWPGRPRTLQRTLSAR
jgi:hypothetical protein